MSRELTPAAKAAKLLRNELKAANISASVRSKNYAGGDSVYITLAGDASEDQVWAARKLGAKYQYGHFDGMTDSYNYDNSREDVPQVRHVLTMKDWRGVSVMA